MYDTELDTFIHKFKTLWNSGLDANLNVETHAGQAWVSLRVQLGKAPGPLHPHFPHHKPRHSPSRERRRVRRADARRKTAEEETNEESKEKETVIEDTETEDVVTVYTSEKVEESDIVEDTMEKTTEDVVEETDINFKDLETREEVKIIPCESCLKFFNYKRELGEHMCDECKVAIAENECINLPNNFQCDICLKTFKTKAIFKKHKHCEFEDNHFTYICEVCTLIWKENETFMNHMKQKHILHTCVRCNMKIEGKENLDQHFRTKHRAF